MLARPPQQCWPDPPNNSFRLLRISHRNHWPFRKRRFSYKPKGKPFGEIAVPGPSLGYGPARLGRENQGRGNHFRADPRETAFAIAHGNVTRNGVRDCACARVQLQPDGMTASTSPDSPPATKSHVRPPSCHTSKLRRPNATTPRRPGGHGRRSDGPNQRGERQGPRGAAAGRGCMLPYRPRHRRCCVFCVAR